MTFTNTAPTALGPGRIWINAAFSRPTGRIPVGASVEYSLQEFVNEYGQRFRAGGFFAIEPPDDLVLVEIEDERGAMAGLIVVEAEAE